MTILHTARLRLEPMTEAHLDGLWAMNSDPAVMRYITGKPETREETLAMIGRVQKRWQDWGIGWWSLFERDTGELIGAAGIHYLGFDPANPHEIGWRLRADKWGKGLAAEAARRIATFAFEELNAPLLCAICDPENRNSSRLMEYLGMSYSRQQEVHAGMVSSVYEITRDDWFKTRASAPPATILETSRLRLEPMTDAHFDGLFAMNSDPDVMRYITGKPDTPGATRSMIERVKGRWIKYGFSWWTFFEKETGDVIGCGCIQHLGRNAENPLEIGWRLRKDKWRQGFASEAAGRMAAFAFDDLNAPLLVAVCQPANTASSRVMERLGMRYRGEEIWYDMKTSRYEITREEWQDAARH